MATKMDEEKREEVCTILLSLLLSRQGSTPVTLLDQEYYDLEKECIPWRKFGYSDLIDFLKSAPRQFLVESRIDGYYVSGIASHKSRHVSSLVSRQKSKPPPRMHHMPRRPIMTRYIPQQRMRNNTLPPNFLHALVQYIRNYPDGVSMQHIREHIQKTLPSITISVPDLRAQLYELTHQLRIDGEIIYPLLGNYTSLSVTNRKQPPPPMLKPRNVPYSAPIEICAGEDEGPEYSEEPDYDYTDEETFIPAGCISKNPSKPSRSRHRFEMNLMQNGQSSEQNVQLYHDNDNDITQNAQFSEQNAQSYHGNNDIDTDTYPNTYENDAINEGASNDENEHKETLLISQRTQLRLRQLLEKYPEGIWCAQLPDKYLEEYKVRLNYIELGFTSVRGYASYLKDIFYMTQENSTDDFLLFSAERPRISEDTFEPNPAKEEAISRERHDSYYGAHAQFNVDNDDPPIPADVPPNITKRFAPENVMNYNDGVSCIRVTDLIARNRPLQAYVVEVFNPSFFWIQLSENKKSFDNFMKDLTEHYTFNYDKYTIPKVALKKGLNCAAIYDRMWHRGIIKLVKRDFRVTVLFYDYGTLKTYEPDEVFYLHKRFSSLPAQAIPCGLYNVKPILSDRWKKSVNSQFIDRIDGHKGLCNIIIKSIDELNNSMMVVLTICEDGETVINDWLVNEKLALRGKLIDAVEMSNIMKYVNNNCNELPSYCFAEENLITDHRQATSTEETHAVPLVSPKETLRDNNTPPVKSSVRPPPGFAPLGEHQPGLLKESTSFCNGSLGNMPNERTPAFGDATEATTNPFLYDQQSDLIISNDIAKSLFVRMWKENLQLQTKLTEMFSEMLEYTPLSRLVFDNHMKVQRQLNKILQSFEKAMTLNNERFVKSPLNPSKETTSNDGSAQGAPIKSNNEVFGNQGVANYANAYSSNVFNVEAQTYWTSPSDSFNPHVQVPLSTTAVPTTTVPTTAVPTTAIPTTAIPTTAVPTTASSMFSNYQFSAGSLYSNANQENDLFSRLIGNSGLSNSDYSSLDYFLGFKNNEPATVIKETNPFKMYMTGNTETPKTPESQQTATGYDSDSSYFSIQNLQNHISKIATSNVGANFHAVNNNSAPAGHVNVNGKENYSTRIVYEAGPVMYNNVQKPKANADSRQSSTCNNNLKTQDASANLGRDGTELLLSSINNVGASHLKQGDILRNDESYVTRSSIDCMTQGPTTMKEELNYYQQDTTNNIPRHVSARTWKQAEIPEHWISSKFQNNVSLQDSKENCTASTPANLSSFQDWNYNNIGNAALPNLNGNIDPHNFNSNNKEKFMDAFYGNMHLWSYLSNPIVNGNSIFVFHKIDSIENISFIFHADREGWMLVHEFVETFTDFKLHNRFLTVLELMNIKISLKEIERSKYPMQFAELDSFPLNVPRDSEKRITSISLISLQNVLSVLLKLKIVTREEIDNVFKSTEFRGDSIPRKVWTLLFTYRELKRRIEQYVKWKILS